ncbi:hypothetical protein [Pedobacter cryoconitis]|uniref:hypothetical protein n=1 Tax=Pedobacter cryoconitis TaxID=188932 RepID=UPI001C85D07E|nr:hypothetical protein [Pedobacter cryoconitis]
MELPDAFADFNYSNEIRPGVYDIYAPGGQSKQEMLQLLVKVKAVIPFRPPWL